MANKRTLCSGFAFLAGAIFLAGCTPAGPAVFDVTGKVTYKGEPMPMKKMGGQSIGGVQVWLAPDGGASSEKKQAVVKEDGTFFFDTGNKPTAGKYKVVVIWQDDYPLGPDKLGKKFDEKNSKILRTIPDDKEIVIDVSRPEG